MCQESNYVFYRPIGVCTISGPEELMLSQGEDKQEYYVLSSISKPTLRAYIPKESVGEHKLRPILTSDEIEKTIRGAKGKLLPEQKNYKDRSAMLNEILSKGTKQDLIVLVHTLHEQTRRLSFAEMDILKRAENIIREEFSFSLKLTPREVDDYVRDELGLSYENEQAQTESK